MTSDRKRRDHYEVADNRQDHERVKHFVIAEHLG